MNTRFFSRVAILLVAALVALACAATPAEAKIWLVSESMMESLGQQAQAELESKTRVIYTNDTARIQAIGNKVAKAAGIESSRASFKLAVDESVNAWTLPGNRIYVTTSMMKFIKSDDELAVLLAHEVGHNTGDHFRRKLQSQILVSLVGAALIKHEKTRNAAVLGANIIMSRGFGFEAEHDADRRGFEYAAAAGYNPAGGAILFQRMLDAYGDGGSKGLLPQIANFINPHPHSSTRVARQLQYLTAYSGGKVTVDGNKVLYESKIVKTGADKYDAYASAGTLAKACKEGKQAELIASWQTPTALAAAY